jgi:hypothetical protein
LIDCALNQGSITGDDAPAAFDRWRGADFIRVVVFTPVSVSVAMVLPHLRCLTASLLPQNLSAAAAVLRACAMPTRDPARAHAANSACQPFGTGPMYGPCGAVARNHSTSEMTAVAEVAETMPATPEVSAWMSHSPAITPMELVLQAAMMAKRMLSMSRVRQNSSRLPRQGSHRGVWRYAPPMCRLASHMAHRATCDRRHHLQQMPCRRIAMKTAGNLPDAPGEVRRSLGHGTGNFWKQLLRRGRNRLGYHRKQLAGSHSNQRQELFRSFVFRLCLGRQFSQVLHHGIGIDLAYRADLVFEFVFEFIFELAFVLAFAFAEQAAQAAKQGAELILLLILEFAFVFQFALVFQLVFEFSCQFVFQLVRHDDSSCGN